MNWFKICALLLAVVAPQCHSYTLNDILLNNFSVDLENEDIHLSPEQTEVISQFIARGFIAAALRQIRSNGEVIKKVLGPGKVPEQKGFPLFPNLPHNICYNASNWTLGGPDAGFQYYHERLTDFQILGMDGSIDSLDIYLNSTDQQLPISLGWTIETPLIEIVGDNRFELDIIGLHLVFQATNSKYVVRDHIFQFMVEFDIFPLNETMSFLDLDISFESTPNVSWVADYLLIFGENETIFTADFGFYISVIEAIWKDSKGLFLPSVVNIIHGFVKDCTVLDLLNNETQSCLNLTLPTYFKDYDLYSVMNGLSSFDKIFDNLFGDGLGVNECPSRDVTTEEVTSQGTSETTDSPPATTPSDAVRASGYQTLSILVTSSLMYIISRFVCV